MDRGRPRRSDPRGSVQQCHSIGLSRPYPGGESIRPHEKISYDQFIKFRLDLDVHVIVIIASVATLDVLIEKEEMPMAWTTPTIIEICIGLEINGYLPAEL